MTRGLLRCAVLGLALLAPSACHRGGSSGSSALATVEVDSVAGGTLALHTGPLAGLRLVVHPGSVSENLQLSVELGEDSPELAFNSIGASVLIRPANVVFSPPATLILPFDKDLLPAGTVDESLEVRRRSVYSGPIGTRSLGVDRVHGHLAVPVDRISPRSTYWPAVRELGASIDMRRYLPDVDFGFYRYSDGNRIQLRMPSAHANISATAPVTELSFIDADGEGGFYLHRTASGEILRLGEYFLGLNSYQELHDGNLWAPAFFSDGGSVSARADYQAVAPFGSSNLAYTGSVSGTTSVELLFESFETPIGRYSDVVRLHRFEEYTDSLGGAGSFEFVLYLAADVGPLAYQLGAGETHLLIEAVVGGRHLAGPIALLKAR